MKSRGGDTRFSWIPGKQQQLMIHRVSGYSTQEEADHERTSPSTGDVLVNVAAFELSI